MAYGEARSEMEGPFHFPDLCGKTLLLTGITQGIGRALLVLFLQQGLRVVAVSRGREEMEAVRREIGATDKELTLLECDLAVPQEVEAATRQLAAFPIDAILHNAAIDPRQPFEEALASHWQAVFQVNLFSAVTLTQACLPRLRAQGRGRIIFTGSVMDELGGAYLSAYVASKAALSGLTRALSHELKGTGITVNCLAPGAIQVEKEQASATVDQLISSWQAVSRRLIPADLLGVLCLLLSDSGSALTGQTITVDGGLVHAVASPEIQRGSLNL